MATTRPATSINLTAIHTILDAHTKRRSWFDRRLFKEHAIVLKIRKHYEQLVQQHGNANDALSAEELLPIFIPAITTSPFDRKHEDAIETLTAFQKLFGVTGADHQYCYYPLSDVIKLNGTRWNERPNWLQLYQQRAQLAGISAGLDRYKTLVGNIDQTAFNEICQLAAAGKLHYALRMADGLAALKMVDSLTNANLKRLRETPENAGTIGRRLALAAVGLDDEENLYALLRTDAVGSASIRQDIRVDQINAPRLARRERHAIGWLIGACLLFLCCSMLPGIILPLVIGLPLLCAGVGGVLYAHHRAERAEQLSIRQWQSTDPFYRALPAYRDMQQRAEIQGQAEVQPEQDRQFLDHHYEQSQEAQHSNSRGPGGAGGGQPSVNVTRGAAAAQAGRMFASRGRGAREAGLPGAAAAARATHASQFAPGGSSAS